MRPIRLALVAAALTLATPALAQTFRAEQIASATQPVSGATAPGQPGRLYIVEQNGRIRILTLGPNTLDPVPFLDISPAGLALTFASGERGLLGLAFHPLFQSNGHFFVNYTRSSDGATVISRWTADPPFTSSLTVDPNSELILRIIPQDFSNHNGGDLHFGPDGFLYIAMGDGGSANDPNERAQNPQSLLGKMLRLDVNNPGNNYIPANNPYVGDPTVLDDIWAFGLRNPFRFSFDRVTGDIYIGDVGQDTREEIDFQPALLPDNSNIALVSARNYGWDCREGFAASSSTDDDCTRPPYTDPIIDHAHPTGCSITGGRVYRGSAIPELDGVYLYADYCSNWIRSLRVVSGAATAPQDLSEAFSSARFGVVAFAEDAAGELYIVRIAGPIYKIVPISGPCGCPCILAGTEGPVFTDTFDTDLAWSVSGTATAGAWTRAVPQNLAGYSFDPVTDGDGVPGFAFITGNSPASVDIDGGSTILTSSALDLSIGAITLCYQYYLNMSGAGAGDGIVTQISSSGLAGPWTTIATHATSNGLAWTRHAITQADLDAAAVTLTSDMRIRFIATDAAPDSTVEAGIDNVRLYSGNIPDCNGNGIDDALDISGGFSQDCNNNAIPDECDIEALVEADCAGGPLGVYDDGQTFFNASCIGCHNANGLGGTGPNLRNVARSTIKDRLTFEVFHPGGVFPNLDDQDFANIEAFLADGSSRARPDGIPDSCQVGLLPDCDNDTTPDACALESGTLADLNYDGIPDSCQPFCPGDITGDLLTNAADFTVLAGNFGAAYPQRRSDGDLNGDGLINAADFTILAGNFGCDQN
jgi:glucose/arabinose dehydrogenase